MAVSHQFLGCGSRLQVVSPALAAGARISHRKSLQCLRAVRPPGHAAYASSKFAVRGFTEVLRQELKSTNIHVSCVHPAGIQTAIADNARLGHQASLQEAVILRERFKKLAPTSSAQAAGTILKGILRNRQRILIGADAYRIDIMQRLAPSRGVDALIFMMGKRALVPATLNAKAR